MKIVIQMTGILLVLIAIMYFIKPDIIKRMMEFFKQGRRIYIVGLLRFALAVIFLLGATHCRVRWVIIALGILFMLGGLLVFMLGPNKIRSIIDWWQKQSIFLLRVLALIGLALGAVIIFAA